MRDAFGGTFLIEILMVFVVLFVSFTAVIVNVAKTFRIKNQVINIVEQTQHSGDYAEQITTYMSNAGYQPVDKDRINKTKNPCNGEWIVPGACVESVNNGDYYRVTVYVSISLPLNLITDTITLPIRGESKSYQSLN